MITTKAGEVVKHGNIEVGLREIGPQQAAEVLEMNYQRQRKLDQRHVAFLANEMEQGRFMQGTKVHACTLPNRQQCLINGQHTVSAILKSGLPQLLTVQITRCKDEEEVAACYAREDLGKRRSKSVLYHAFGMEDLLGCKNSEAVLLGAAIEFLVQGVVGAIPDRKMSPVEIMDLSKKMSWRYESFKQAKTDGRLQVNASLIALALVTADSDFSHDFWWGVATDDGLRNTDARKVFLNFIRDRKVEDIRNKVGGVKYSEAIFRIGAYCFNCFVGQKAVKVIPYTKALQTDRILDTEFSAGASKQALEALITKEKK